MLFTTLQPVIAAGRPFGGASLESYLLTRHLAIDALLERAIERGGVTQVVEIACGLSSRGWRFAQRHGERITYVEADLPGMAARKRAALDRIGCLSDHHRVVALDALHRRRAGEPRGARHELRGTGASRSSPRDCSATCPAGGRRPVAAGRRRAGQVPGRVATSPICTWRRSRTRRCGSSGWRCRRSCAGGSTSTSMIPRSGERALRDGGFASARLRGASEIAGTDRGRGSDMAHIIEASST